MSRRRFLSLIWILFLALSASAFSRSAHQVQSSPRVEPTPPVYEFAVQNVWLSLKDGVRLSVTFCRPVPREPGEKFPVLLEFLPYRKDDGGGGRVPPYPYFAKRGFIIAKVDIRGTGSSDGVFPGREYTEQELDDAVEIIDQLSKMPDSNGRVGMFGISWGGFNSIQVAMRQPPALKAILATDATDDLYHDDVHYIDGVLEIDPWATEFYHSLALPQTPNWPLDESFFRDRFDQYPGFLTYLKQQRDGEFWRKNSLRWQYDKIRIPTYLIGGLLDGYRDAVPRMLENMKVPVMASVGPWNHSYPDYGLPGPNYEWKHEAVRWWDYWLKDRNTGIMDEPRLTIFIRDGHGPDEQLKMTPGRWVCEDWPIPGTQWKKFYPGDNHQLQINLGEKTVENLRYVPSYGIATSGLSWYTKWWGDPKGDMRPDDAGSLFFDSLLLEEEFEIVGLPKVHLRVSADAPLAHWVARLEDVQPDGTVSLVAGALLNGSQRESRLEPKPLVPGEIYNIEFEMHFTTWTFKPGHRIRLTVSNALFPMVWPSPYAMMTKLFTGTESTCLELPIIPAVKRKAPSFRPPEPREESQLKRIKDDERPDAAYFGAYFWPQASAEYKRDLDSTVSLDWKGARRNEVQGARNRSYYRDYQDTNDKNPAKSSYHGERGRLMEFEARTIELRTKVDITSDETNFYVVFLRKIFLNGALLRQREWKETIKRDFQ